MMNSSRRLHYQGTGLTFNRVKLPKYKITNNKRNINYVFLNFRDISINGLIGIIGGYIGLFLGYSIVQIPDIISTPIQNWKLKFFLRVNKENVNSGVSLFNKRTFDVEGNN